jgi:hypothetical protein
MNWDSFAQAAGFSSYIFKQSRSGGLESPVFISDCGPLDV